MQDMKFKVKDEKHSEEIQECLFKLGFGWAFGGRVLNHRERPFLYGTIKCDKSIITYGEHKALFDERAHKETTLEELKQMLNQTKKQPHKHAELIKAWADGAEIQVHDTGEWLDVFGTPSWFTDSKYRIKPKDSDLDKYGIEVGDIWLCGRTRKFDCVAGISYEGKPMSLIYNLSPVKIENGDILVFRKGVVDRTREFTI